MTSTAIRDFKVHARKPGSDRPESQYEKVMVLPLENEKEPARHLWADARFAADILSEHGFFFALLMPEELAPKERAEALKMHKTFGDLFKKIEAGGPPGKSDMQSFAREFTEPAKRFIDYKARLGEASKTGQFRSLVWPLFFDHTRHEAERWNMRIEAAARGNAEYDRHEVVAFWTNIMDEHCRFIAHLLDPDEFELIDTAMKTSDIFKDLGAGASAEKKALGNRTGAGIPSTPLGHEAKPVSGVKHLVGPTANPDMDAVMNSANTLLDFKTKAAREIEAGRIKSIIDPRLADHVRREALKFVDEIKRA